MLTALVTGGYCTQGHRRAFDSDLRLPESRFGRRTTIVASSDEVVDDKGAKYDDKFRHLLREFPEKLQPV
ncbi:hypothetical protein WJX77_005635 [Trebouxia sp. C0004]